VTALWLHLRTSPLRWAVAPMVVTTLMAVLLRTDYWVGIWPETGAAGQLPAFYLSVVAAGAAAWASGSTSRHALEEQMAAAALAPPVTEAYRLGATTILLLVPYLAGQAVAFALTARTFPPGVHLWLGYVLMGLVVMLMATAWGWAVGRYLSPAYGALVAVLSWLMFEGLVGLRADLTVMSGPTWMQPAPGALAVRLLAVAVFGAALVWASRRGWDGDARRAALPAVAGIAAVAATLGTTVVSDRDVPRDPLCVDGRIEMCLWPEDEKYVAMVRALDVRVTELPEGFRLPPRLNQYGLERSSFPFGGEVVTQLEGDFDISEGHRSALALGLSNEILEETLRPCDLAAIDRAEDPAPEVLRRWVELFLNAGDPLGYRAAGVPDDIAAAWKTAADVARLPGPEQRAWADRELSRMHTTYCG
jgi:hypothetical protein